MMNKSVDKEEATIINGEVPTNRASTTSSKTGRPNVHIEKQKTLYLLNYFKS